MIRPNPKWFDIYNVYQNVFIVYNILNIYTFFYNIPGARTKYLDKDMYTRCYIKAKIYLQDSISKLPVIWMRIYEVWVTKPEFRLNNINHLKKSELASFFHD